MLVENKSMERKTSSWFSYPSIIILCILSFNYSPSLQVPSLRAFVHLSIKQRININKRIKTINTIFHITLPNKCFYIRLYLCSIHTIRVYTILYYYIMNVLFSVWRESAVLICICVVYSMIYLYVCVHH